MSWPLLGIISIIGVIFLRVFHKQIISSDFMVRAIYINNRLYNLKDERKIVQTLLTTNKDSSHFPELLAALKVLLTEPSVFPSEQVFSAAENLISSLPKTHGLQIVRGFSVLPFSTNRGYGGIEKLHGNDGSTTYLIGHINSILKMSKNTHDKEEIVRLNNKYSKQSSTNVAIAVYENESHDKNVLYDGFNKKIDLIGCLFITSGT